MQACYVLTTLDENQRKALDVAVIKDMFKDVKKFSVGSCKPGNEKVTAKRVIDILPFFEYAPNRMTMATFDHDIKENLHEAAKEQLSKISTLNELLIMKKYGKATNKSAAMYTKTSNEPLVSQKEDGQISLGNAKYELKREYDYFISTESQLRHNILFYLKSGKIRYIKPSSIFTMSKKKANPEALGKEIPQRIFISAREYTTEEITRSNKKYKDIGVRTSTPNRQMCE